MRVYNKALRDAQNPTRTRHFSAYMSKTDHMLQKVAETGQLPWISQVAHPHRQARTGLVHMGVVHKGDLELVGESDDPVFSLVAQGLVRCDRSILPDRAGDVR